MVSQFDIFNKLCRNSADNGIGSHILCNHRAGSYNSSLSNGYTLGDYHIGADPHPIFDENWLITVVPVIGVESVVNGCQHHIVPDQDIVPDENTSLILKMAAGIDKDIFPIWIFRPKSA